MTGRPLVWSAAAPAKVNLRLAVLEREPSGYHRIETVFQRLELADRVELRVGDEGAAGSGEVRLEVMGVGEGELGPDSDNLAVRAARGFLEALEDAGRASGPPNLSGSAIEIRLEKRIPHGAGLGGGSSDAAAVLRGLNELSGRPFAPEELIEFGGELGADVPFFVSGAARALGVGRGDRIVPLPPLPVRHILLAVPEEGISTAWAYETLARARAGAGDPVPDPGRRPGVRPREAPVAADWAAVEAEIRNDFEPALFPLRPDLERLKAALVQAGARPALLSGSGAAVFGGFADPAAVARAEEAVRRVRGVKEVIVTETSDREH